MKEHEATIHGIGKVLHCSKEGCSYRTGNKSNMKSHMSHKHDVGVVLFKCRVCQKQFKQAGILKVHLAGIHEMGEIYRCVEEGCNFFAGSASHLKRHVNLKHTEDCFWEICFLDDCGLSARRRVI